MFDQQSLTLAEYMDHFSDEFETAQERAAFAAKYNRKVEVIVSVGRQGTTDVKSPTGKTVSFCTDVVRRYDPTVAAKFSIRHNAPSDRRTVTVWDMSNLKNWIY